MNARAENREGYVLELPYTWSFFGYQSPAVLNYVAARAGRPVIDLSQPFTYCDLGCGNGLTAVMIAAAFPHATIYGVDFNPEHVENARRLAEAAGINNAHFLAETFGGAAGGDMPPVDFVTMHGIYSWVNGAARDEIHAFLAAKASDRCLSYVCYNAYPGATELLPMWKIMQSFQARSGKPVTQTVPAGLKLLQEVERRDGIFFRENPHARRRLETIGQRNLAYLVHEFGNGDFEPQFFSDVNRAFEAQGFGFAGQAQLERNNRANTISSRLRPMLDDIDDPAEQESVASFLMNEGFRWDVYARAAPVAVPEGSSRFDGLHFVAVGDLERDDGRLRLGRRRVQADEPVIAALHAAFGPEGRSFARARRDPAFEGVDLARIEQALDDLVTAERLRPSVQPAREALVPPGAPLRLAHPVNRAHIEDRLMIDGRVYLVSPVLGNALRFSFVDACCIRALDRASGDPAEVLAAMLAEQGGRRQVRRAFGSGGITPAAARACLDAFLAREGERLLRLGILERCGG